MLASSATTNPCTSPGLGWECAGWWAQQPTQQVVCSLWYQGSPVNKGFIPLYPVYVPPVPMFLQAAPGAVGPEPSMVRFTALWYLKISEAVRRKSEKLRMTTPQQTGGGVSSVHTGSGGSAMPPRSFAAAGPPPSFPPSSTAPFTSHRSGFVSDVDSGGPLMPSSGPPGQPQWSSPVYSSAQSSFTSSAMPPQSSQAAFGASSTYLQPSTSTGFNAMEPRLSGGAESSRNLGYLVVQV